MVTALPPSLYSYPLPARSARATQVRPLVGCLPSSGGVVVFLREDLKRLMVGATVLHGKTSLSQPARLSHRPLVAFLDFLVAFNVSCRMGVRHLLVLSRTHPFNTRRTRCIASASKQKILPSRHKTHSISKRIDFHI